MLLYPDSQDIIGEMVLIIVDSVPGRYSIEMLVALRSMRLYLMVGVPNTTHVTQTTDQKYGPFKTIYRKNLTELTWQRQAQGLTIRLVYILILVFGDGDKLRNKFNETFRVNTNLAIWKLIGISLITCKCLEDNKVKHEIVVLRDGTIGIEADPFTNKLISIEKENNEATYFLIANGYDGDQLECPAPKIPRTRLSVTVTGSRQRKYKLSKASNAGIYFIYTK